MTAPDRMNSANELLPPREAVTAFIEWPCSLNYVWATVTEFSRGQGQRAPGGTYGHTVNGNMLAANAMTAPLADYGRTEIQTVIINNEDVLHNAYFDGSTNDVAQAMTQLDLGEK